MSLITSPPLTAVRSSQLARCDELWFEDGTVVIRAADMLFRVYKGVLSRQSSFFKTLFEVPQPPDAETYDGCPLVLLQGDSAEDVRDFLVAIHDVDWPETITQDGFALAGLLQLSVKYEFPSVRRRVVKLLLATFPTTLAEYDALAARRALFAIQERYISSVPELVALARAMHAAAPQLLPYTLWKLVRAPGTDWSFIFQGVEGRAGRIFLPVDLQRAVVQGRIALSTAARTIVFPQLFAPTTALHCDWQRLRLLPAIMLADGYTDPIVEQPFEGLCDRCKAELKQEAKLGRAAVWQRLPEFLGLGGWNELAQSAQSLDS